VTYSLSTISYILVCIIAGDETLEPSILEIQAPTSDSVLYGPVASQHSEVLTQVSNLYQVSGWLAGWLAENLSMCLWIPNNLAVNCCITRL